MSLCVSVFGGRGLCGCLSVYLCVLCKCETVSVGVYVVCVVLCMFV